MRDVRAQLAADVLPLDLASISGRAFYRAAGRRLHGRHERPAFRTREGLAAQPADFSLSRARRGRPAAPRRGPGRRDRPEDRRRAPRLLPVPRERQGAGRPLRAPRAHRRCLARHGSGDVAREASAYRVKGALRGPRGERGRPVPGRLRPHRHACEGTRTAASCASPRKGSTFERAAIFRAASRPRRARGARHVDARCQGASRCASSEARLRQRRRGARRVRARTGRSPTRPKNRPGWVDLSGRDRAGATPTARRELPAQRHRGRRATGSSARCSPATEHAGASS